MRGTRYGDFSRLRPAASYRAVLMQQGRVQLDSDWNEQVALGQAALATALGDVLGPAWGPDGDGLRVRPHHALVLDGETALSFPAGPVATFELWLTWKGGAGVLVREAGAERFALRVDDRGHVVLRAADGRGIAEVEAASPLPLGRPVHVAVVLDGSGVVVLADGVQIGYAPLAAGEGQPADDPSSLVVGGAGTQMLLSGVRMWPGARTGDQLLQGAAQGPRAQGDDALTAAWPLVGPPGGVLVDAVGGRQAKTHGDGEPRRRLADLDIAPGRYYVGGVPFELTGGARYTHQPGFADAPLPHQGVHLAYLEVWEDSVGVVEDPSLREPALGDLDTTVRTRVVGRVRLARVEEDQEDRVREDPVGALDDVLARRGRSTTGRMAARRTPERRPSNFLYRVEVHHGGRLDGGGESEAAFKWSRRNGADVFAIGRTDQAHRITVAPPIGATEPLAPGDVVEPLGSGTLGEGAVHVLLTVEEVPEEGLAVLDGPLPHDAVRLRRWEQGPVAVRDAWHELEDGIEVRFTPGSYRAGDYWWIVAREQADGLDWVQEGSHPVPRPPDGVERLVAPLTLLEIDDGRAEALDLRRLGPVWSPERSRDREDETEVFEEEELFEDDDEGGIVDEPWPADDAPSEPWPGVPVDPEPHAEREPEPEPEPFEPPPVEPPPVAPAPVSPPPPSAPSGAIITRDSLPPLGYVEEKTRLAVEAGWRALGDLRVPPGTIHGVARLGEHVVLALEHGLHALAPETGDVTLLAELPVPRSGFMAAAVDDVMLLLGGHRGDGDHDRLVIGYDLTTGKWTERAPMPVKHRGAVAVTAGAEVHVLGGHLGLLLSFLHPTHHVYDPDADRWRRAPRLPAHRRDASASTLGHHVHVTGGTRRRRPVHHHHAYHRKDQKWHREPHVPGHRHVVASCSHDGHLHVLVKHPHRDAPQSALTHEPVSGTWSNPLALPEWLDRPALVSHGRSVVAVGRNRHGKAVAYSRESGSGLRVYLPT